LAVFRSPSLAKAWEMLMKIFVPAGGKPAPLVMSAFWFTVAIVVIGHVAGVWLSRSPFDWKRAWTRIPAPVLGTAGAMVLVFAVVLGPGVTKAFIYFTF
jgi:hypothetical protein